MDKRRFVFGVDLDGVCADFYEGLRPIAAEWLDVPVEQLPPSVKYGLPEWGVDKAPGGYKALHRFAVTQRELFRKLEPIPGAPAALRRLNEREVHIRIITNRLFIHFSHQEAVSQTIDWLDHCDIPYRDLCLMRDKAAVGADIYVDDTPDNVDQLRAEGHHTIVFTNSTNLAVDGPRADDWKALEEMVLEAQKEWLDTNG